ncbi:glycoside hydrolase family 16 protein [Geodermatophilus nigrescens]|uniref:Glycosyl hydrolases family 16 n=1 Tax=Geodermatophilus nigrescens TaxID=1070870 RepID=A0A1M5EK87_9ACTN|nr:glycoside hydrolase family 16 protein [Geodermatophilus nigrescens]SHF79462.1 Glycosyl hydrolases family 16 [Geodermatophilus nigrescens]
MTPADDSADDFADDFDGPGLDLGVWVPHYLPQWSSRAATAARYEVRDSCLHLSLPDDVPLWCPDDHPPLRVSGIQSGVFSGPVGSTVGQQPVRPGAVVREEQPAHWGWTPRYGRLEMRARATVTPRSMVAWWLVGLEDVPERCGELCVMEVFGDAVDPAEGAAVGMGTHPFRDPRLVEDFAAPRPGIDVAEWHVYAVDWRPDGAVFSVDGRPVREVAVTPDYPVQTMLAVFDFPERAVPGEPYVVPELVVDRIGGETGVTG